jgi:glutamyl/glutaminyl-tRNA synthetase
MRTLSATIAVMESPRRTRFAPSPTGYLHLGNARTALFNYFVASASGGTFVLRSEDTDAERSDDAMLAALCEDLRWLGLDWGEGPDRDGPYGPYTQSARSSLYARHLERLAALDRVYPCFCTQSELALARRVQQAAGTAAALRGHLQATRHGGARDPHRTRRSGDAALCRRPRESHRVR